jgi:hypothetical protein
MEEVSDENRRNKCRRANEEAIRRMKVMEER